MKYLHVDDFSVGMFDDGHAVVSKRRSTSSGATATDCIALCSGTQREQTVRAIVGFSLLYDALKRACAALEDMGAFRPGQKFESGELHEDILTALNLTDPRVSFVLAADQYADNVAAAKQPNLEEIHDTCQANS